MEARLQPRFALPARRHNVRSGPHWWDGAPQLLYFVHLRRWCSVLTATVIIAFGPYDGTNQKGAAGLKDPKDRRATTDADHKIAPKDVLRQATVDTLACLSKAPIEKLQVLDALGKSNETLQFLDALAKSGGVRNLKWGVSKIDCVHVPRGTEIAIDAWDSDNGIAKVFVRRVGRKRYMVAKDIGAIDQRLRFRPSP